jgi:hypothetical protein
LPRFPEPRRGDTPYTFEEVNAMRLSRRAWLLIALLIFVIVAAAGIGGYFWLSATVTKDQFGETTVVISVGPLSVEDARKGLMFPLPDEATEIQYACFSEWIAYEFVLKFKSPVEVCKSHALLLLKQHNEEYPDRSVPVALTPIAGLPESVTLHPSLEADWFDAFNIKQGVCAESFGSHDRAIWVDTERGLFYCRVTD